MNITTKEKKYAIIVSPAKQYSVLPQSWIKAAGVLSKYKIDGLDYQKKTRKQWDARLKRQHKLDGIK